MRLQARNSELLRNQLSRDLIGLEGFSRVVKPGQGWIRSMRLALGMSGKQFAERLGVEPPRVTNMEKAELSESLTLRSLEKAAAALDCRLVYAFVPNTSLEDTVRQRAASVAARRLQAVSHTMRLEDQAPGSAAEKKLLEEMTEELIRERPGELWDADDAL